MKISEELQEKVQEMEKELGSHKTEIKNLEFDRDTIQTNYDVLQSKMNWRERNIRGWFGGVKEKVRQADEYIDKLADLDEKISDAEKKVNEADALIESKIVLYLRNNDKTYTKLKDVWDHIAEVQRAVDSYMYKIDSALSDISSAQGMETIDLFTKSKMVSLMSSSSNSGAQIAIDEVKKATEPFQESLERYNGFLKSNDIQELRDIEIGDGIDLLFDFVFDGFDFMSLSTLSNLSSAENELNDLRNKVYDVKNKIDEQYKKAEKGIENYVKKVRRAIKYES